MKICVLGVEIVKDGLAVKLLNESNKVVGQAEI